ncbi:MAG: 6-carboxytetrahydropterin synthase QueD [Chloroflexota bacterium]|nr:6-carboxytetrahydropterin synthase QueD [Chloroflexota bacterium]
MYEISVRVHFDAAHALREYQGKCENLHGHRFEIVANLRSTHINNIGMVYDFVELRKQLTSIVNEFDHSYLNDQHPFDAINPSSENIATHIFRELSKRITDPSVTVHSLEVWESPNSRVTYFPNA